METSRWERIQELFHELSDLSPEEQQVRLAVETAEMRDEVQKMLDEDRQAAGFLDRPMEEIASQVLDDEATLPMAARQIGPYKLEHVLGEGGMGTVFFATRADLGSTAAIKILRDAWLSPARRERFRLEQRTLAQLDHSNIARFLDADTLPDGTPYIVMEYVDGVPLDQYCKDQALSVPQRVELFRKVCGAVQFAHQRAILHRDLKPSNILVKADGTAKLLDFGIAKKLAEFDTPAAELTQTGLRLFTPAYASPEQMEGKPAAIPSDVYSLGVILYQLLTGRLPGEVVTTIAGIPSDLDVLCRKAMHRDPEQRYPSCEALLRDVEHFQRGEPLEARPDSASYRLRKFVERHRTAVLAGMAAIIAVAAGSIYFTIRLAAERNAALAEAAKAQRIQRFMLDLFHGGDKASGPASDLRVISLLERGVQSARTLDQDPAAQSELYQTLGSIYQQLGKLDQADALLQHSVSRPHGEGLIALGLLRIDQAKLDEAETFVRQGLDESRKRLPPGHPLIAAATDALGRVYEEKGAYDQAIPMLEEAVRLRSKSTVGPSAELASSLYELANVNFYTGKYKEAEALNQRVLSIHRQIYGERHPRVAEILVNLGAIQQDLGHYVEAEQFHRQALEISRGFFGENHYRTAVALTMVARALVYQKRLDAAQELLHQALAILEQVFGKVHPRVASTLNELGNVAVMQNRYDDARSHFTRMVATYRQIHGENHYLVGTALSNLGSTASGAKDYAEAERLFREAIAIYQRTLPAGHVNIGIARIKLGRSLLRQKQYEKAEVESLAGYENVRRQTSPSVSYLNSARTDLISIYEALAKPEKASILRKEMAAVEAKR